MNETSYAELKKFKDQYNVDYSIGDLTPTICEINNIPFPEQCGGTPIAVVVDHAQRLFDGEGKNEKTFIYCPDAVGEIHRQHYPELLARVEKVAGIRLLSSGVMPSVTPVCFGTIFSGASPEVHGITRYAKPVLEVETLFDVAPKAGKKVAIVAGGPKCSLANIFLEREAVDYYIMANVEEVNAKAAELIIEDKHDFILAYNGNYDSTMHKNGPEAAIALGELRANARTFGAFAELIKTRWKNHNTLLGFAMDHGCHEIDGNCGSHGLDMPEDLNIKHFYQIYPKA